MLSNYLKPEVIEERSKSTRRHGYLSHSPTRAILLIREYQALSDPEPPSISINHDLV